MSDLLTSPAVILFALLLVGCAPAPLSDAQVKAVTERCKELGMATYLFNSVIVSRAECIPVTVTP